MFSHRPLRSPIILLGAISLVLLLPGVGFAQRGQGAALPSPRLLSVTPAGGQAGTTVEVSFAGNDLEEPQALLFSHPSFKAERVNAPAKAVADRRPEGRRRRPDAAPVVAVKFKVTIPKDAPLGLHDVRLVNAWGVSNPRAFAVGDLAETMEKEPNNDVDAAQRIALNTTINGAVTTPTDVDYFTFAGRKGERVLLSCQASSIDSRLTAYVQLYDAAGKPLGANRNYADADALLDCTLPADGDYVARVSSFTYTQGSPDHYYRLSVTTAPWIDAIFPPVVEPGKPARLTVYGRNLPGGKPDPANVVDGTPLEKITVTVDVPNDPVARQRLAYSGHLAPTASALDGFEYRVRNAAGSSNPYLLTYAAGPLVTDNGSNDDPGHAQEVPVPCEIAGRIEKRRDRDWYAFSAKKGEVYSIELVADRRGSPIDPYFVLRSADGKQILGEFDDNNEPINSQFFSRSEDPARYRLAVPKDGVYELMVSCREASLLADPRALYQVRITAEQPDFHLVVMPPSPTAPEGCVLYKGGRQYYSVFVDRQDGWNGEIELSIEGLPKGVTCSPQRVGTGMRLATLVMSAAGDAPVWTGAVRVTGTATVNGKKAVREARPATIVWPVPVPNIPTLSRLDRNLVLAIRDLAPPFNLTAASEGVTVQAGERVTIPLKIERLSPDLKTPIQLVALNLPQNMQLSGGNNRIITVPPDAKETKPVLDIRNGVAPGTYTVVFVGTAQVPFSKDPKSKQKANVNVSLPSTPVNVTVLPKQLASVSVSPSSAKLKPGGRVEVKVKVNRMFDYDGAFKVELVKPPKDVSAEPVTIAAGKIEATLVVEASPEAKPGSSANLVVKVAAIFKGKEVRQEAKLSLSVTK